MSSGPLGPVRRDSQDVDTVTVEFRRSRGGVVVTALMADASLDDISTACPWRTFRWYKGQRHYSGWYWSATDQCSVIYESRLEQCRLLYADFDLSVSHILAQPFMLRARVKSVGCQHVPDYLLITENGPVVVDVKPKDKLEDPVVASTLAWTRAAIESRGWSYEVWSEPTAVELNNLRFLSGFRRARQFRQELVSELRNTDLDNVSIGAATEGLAGWRRPLVRSTLLHLVWLQYFHVDLSRPLSASHILTPGAAPRSMRWAPTHKPPLSPTRHGRR